MSGRKLRRMADKIPEKILIKTAMVVASMSASCGECIPARLRRDIAVASLRSLKIHAAGAPHLLCSERRTAMMA
jgi:hypothetical protein